MRKRHIDQNISLRQTDAYLGKFDDLEKLLSEKYL